MYESQAENIVQEQDTITEVKTVSKPKSVKQQIATGKKKKKPRPNNFCAIPSVRNS